MNFEPSRILPSSAGSNADARTVSVRIMNEREPTPQQLAQLGRMFEEHRKALGNSVAGFLVKSAVFPDGSRARIVSNSGIHTLELWPAGGSVRTVLVEDFWGIPANQANVNGTLDPPSGYWRVPAEASAMPPELKQKRAYLAASDPTHPGPVTWSSADFKADGQPIVLCWRGPRDRYAATSGWATSSGFAIVEHNNAGQPIGQEVFKDSPYLWINGRKVETPVNKIIAAAIHCPDPEGAPGICVLRIATDNVSGDGTTRKLGTKDLVPTGATAAVGLGALLSASSYDVLATHIAANNDNTTALDHWQLGQRPHFDHNGARLACTIIFGDGFSAMVSLDAESFAILEQFDCRAHGAVAGSGTVTDTGSGSNPRTITISRSEVSTYDEVLPLAVDFLDGTLVRCWVERSRETGNISNEQRVRTDTGGTITIAETHDTTWPHVLTRMAFHSLHGELHTEERDGTYSTTWTWDGTGNGNGSYPGFADAAHFGYSFVGNLAADVFAIGYVEGDGVVVAAASGPAPFTTSFPRRAVASTQTTTVRPMKYDLWMKGEKRVSATAGSFVGLAAATGDTTAGGGDVTRNYMQSYLGGTLEPPISGGGDIPDPIYSSGQSIAFPNPAAWAHAAVNASREIAYLGIYHTIAASGTVSPAQAFGLETCLFLPKAGTFTQAEVPAYSAGDKPTISAPVFPGVTRKELA